MTRINVAVYGTDYLYMATFVQLRRYCGSGIFLKMKLFREKHIHSFFITLHVNFSRLLLINV